MIQKASPHLAIFLALLAAIHPTPCAPQEGKMLNAKDFALEWEYLGRIRNGENIPTTIQSLSAREAKFYGIDAGTETNAAPGVEPKDSGRPASSGETGATESDVFFHGLVSVQPFVVGWDGFDLGRWEGDGDANCKDTSRLTRFRLDDPVLLLGLSFGSESLFGTIDLDFGTDSLARYAEGNGVTGFWKPLDYLSYWTFPEAAYLSWSDRHATVAAGRLATGIGLGDTNILLNGQARWYDQIQFSWWSDKFRFFAFWGTSSSHLSDGEYSVQSWTAAEDDPNPSSWGWDSINNHDASTQAVVPYKLFNYHKLEFKPWSRVGFGLSEMQIVGGKIPDLTNLLPTTIWHNTYSAGVSNVMADADVWFVPVDGLLVFGEFLMDDSKAPKEDGVSKPTCWAWEIGTTAVLPADIAGWRLSATAEYSHVDKWTYNRWQPYLTMYQRQLITGGQRGYDIPLGHPEGGDVDQIGIAFTALARNGRRIEAGYTFIDKGPVYLGRVVKNPAWTAALDGVEPEYLAVYYDYDEYRGSGALEALLGSTRKISHVINLKAVWPLSRSWEANAEIDFRYILNAEHVAGATATETVWSAGLKWTCGN